jgi:hypothetical protein
MRIQKGKNDPQKQKKVNKFHVLMCWMFSFEDWTFVHENPASCRGRQANYQLSVLEKKISESKL